MRNRLPERLVGIIQALGKHASPQSVQQAILELCGWQPLAAKQLAHLLGRNVAYLQNRYIQPLIATKRLEYLFPDNPAHPRHAYRTVGKSQDLS